MGDIHISRFETQFRIGPGMPNLAKEGVYLKYLLVAITGYSVSVAHCRTADRIGRRGKVSSHIKYLLYTDFIPFYDAVFGRKPKANHLGLAASNQINRLIFSIDFS